MNNGKEKLKSLLGQGFTSNQIKLIGLEGDEEGIVDDDETREVRSTHSSLDGVDSVIDLSDEEFNSEVIPEEKPTNCQRCGCNYKGRHECRVNKPLPQQSSKEIETAISSDDQVEKEDIDDEVLSRHSSLGSVSSMSTDSTDSDEDYKPNSSSVRQPKRKTEKSFKVKDMSRHQQTRPHENPFKCDKCKRIFSRKTWLNHHVCGDLPAFLCPQCDSRFLRKRDLHDHLIKMHNIRRSQLLGSDCNPTPILFKCTECFRTYKTKDNLDRHAKFECGGSSAFSCTLCGLRSSRKHNLKIHLIRKHRHVDASQLDAFVDGPSFQCGLCPFRAQLKTALQSHIRAVHINGK